MVEYSLDDGTTRQLNSTFSGLAAGAYYKSVRYTDGSCALERIETIQIVRPIAPIITDVQTEIAADCESPNASIVILSDQEEDDLLFSIDGGDSWHTSPVFTDLEAGAYQVSIRYINGSCQVDAPEVLNFAPPIVPEVNEILIDQPSSCEINDGQISIISLSDQELEYSIDGGQNWSSNSIFEYLSCGTFQVSISVIDGSCQVDAGEIISIEAPTAPQLTGIKQFQPNNWSSPTGQIVVNSIASRTLEYSIDGGENWGPDSVFMDFPIGSYRVSIRYSDGTCQFDANESIEIEAPESIAITDIVVNQPSSCDSNAASITILSSANGGLEYSIDDGENWSPASVFAGLHLGSYLVSIRYSNGTCQVDANEPIRIEATESIAIVDVVVNQPASCDSNQASLTILSNAEMAIETWMEERIGV